MGDEDKSEQPPAPATAENANAANEGGNDKDPHGYYDRLVRVSADFDNYRKRYQKERSDWAKYGAEHFIKAFLPIIDNLERAVQQCPQDGTTEPIRKGLNMVMDQMYRNLQAEGVHAFAPMGEPFDPLIHEALTTKEDDSVAPQTVVAVHHKGFKLWDRLLRPARVTVSVTSNQNQTSSTEGNE